MSASSLMGKKRQDVSVKINAEVYRLVRTVAAWRGVSIAEYLSEIVAPVVRRDLKEVNRQSARHAGQDGAEGEGGAG
jgi:hypothetical protein